MIEAGIHVRTSRPSLILAVIVSLAISILPPWPAAVAAGSGTDLEVSTSIDTTFADAGDTVVVSITLANTGAAVASGIVVQFETTDALGYLGHSGGVYDPTTGRWAVDALGGGSSQVLELSLQVVGTGTIPYSARVLIVDQVDDPDSVQGNRDEFEDDQSSGSVMTPPCSVDDDHDLWPEPVAAVLVMLPIEDGVCLDYDPERTSLNPGSYSSIDRLVTVQSSPINHPGIDLGMVTVHEVCHSHQYLVSGGGGRNDWWASPEGARFLELTGSTPGVITYPPYTPYEDAAQHCAIWYNAFHTFGPPTGERVPRARWAAEYLPNPIVTRQGGSNRYETAAVVVRQRWPHPMPDVFPGEHRTVLFVATGSNYPDALAGAATGSPLLLIAPDSIPAATIEQLERLGPRYISILGGTSAVSASVANALEAYASDDVWRISGVNRYETAVELSLWSNPDGAGGTVYVATGLGFADALAGAAAASHLRATVLLTPPTTLPPVVRDEIIRIAPDEIIVLGGTAAVSDPVVAELDTLAPARRIAGTNRYDTAVKISQDTFEFAPVVYLATGVSFPDALAGAGIAGSRHAPILLTPPDSLPQIVADEILRLNATEVVILGGPAAVSRTVQEQLATALGGG